MYLHTLVTLRLDQMHFRSFDPKENLFSQKIHTIWSQVGQWYLNRGKLKSFEHRILAIIKLQHDEDPGTQGNRVFYYWNIYIRKPASTAAGAAEGLDHPGGFPCGMRSLAIY